VTKEAVAHAKKYVQGSLKSQKRLGYGKPAAPEVVDTAVAEAAAAFDALLALRESTQNARR
jgi:hypothetical protein